MLCWTNPEVPLKRTHHLQEIRRNHLHATHCCCQSTDNGGDDIESAHTEQQVLQETAAEYHLLSQGHKAQEMLEEFDNKHSQLLSMNEVPNNWVELI